MVLLAVAIGCSMMAKLSGGTVAPAVAVLFILKLLKAEDNIKESYGVLNDAPFLVGHSRERSVHIARSHGTYTYPSDFILIAAMNPCHCGFYPDLKRCCCGEREIHRYLDKVSRPLLVERCTIFGGSFK